MPDLDVSDLLEDPDFAEELTIKRRTASEGTDGRQTITETEISPKPYGVVLPVDTAIGGNALERAADAQYRGSNYAIHTKFRLRGPAPGFQPDVVMIEGDPYVVTIVNSFSKYGQGFMKVEVVSMSLIDHPPE